MQKFGSNVDFRKVDFLGAEKISHRSGFLTNVNNEKKNIKVMNQTQPVLSSLPHLER